MKVFGKLAPVHRMSSKKRKTAKRKPVNDLEGFAAKKQRIAKSMVRNINKMVDDDSLCDTLFIIGNEYNKQGFRGIAALFAAHSAVLKSMLFGGMQESSNKEVVIADITPSAFEFIKCCCYASNAELKVTDYVDVLYAAKKYMI